MAQPRTNWEKETIRTIASLVRLEGEHVSLDGGITTENAAPAINRALEDIVEHRVIPLLRALAARDSAEALRLVRQYTHREMVLEETGELVPDREPLPPAAGAALWLKTVMETPPHDSKAQERLSKANQRLMAERSFLMLLSPS